MSIVEGLVKDYKRFKIDIPFLELPDQGITALWGPSGSGKTTLFRILLGLENCSGLSWKFNNQDLAKLDIADRKIGVVFKTTNFFPI